MKISRSVVGAALFLALLSFQAKAVLAFCGFFVAKVDAELFNNRSEVAIARTDSRTTYNLAFNYKGAPKDFALVLPVPVVLKKEDVKVIDAQLFDRLDDFSAPRLVRYDNTYLEGDTTVNRSAQPVPSAGAPVQVLERFTVGEYDVVILSANESNALETWLRENDYKTPRGAAPYLRPYIDGGMYFFVVRVNLEEQEKLGFQQLRPLQFGVPNGGEIMLPFQMGKINAEDKQSVIIYFLTAQGRVEAKNYTNVMIPSNFNVPEQIEPRFGEFYQDLLAATIKATGRETVVTEYAWDTGSCDPCSTQPLNGSELRALGMNQDSAFITRMHLQYTKNTYNQDLVFRVTRDTRTYQGRYILTPKSDLVSIEAPNTAEVRAPYGKLLSAFPLQNLFTKYSP